MKICHVTSELTPLAKAGGLGDVVAALSAYLARNGEDVRTFLPRYGHMDLSGYEVHPVDFLQNVELTTGPHRYTFSVQTLKIPGTDHFGLYLIDCPALYHRGRIYDAAGDEHLRFAVLCRAVFECCQRMSWGPDVLHCHDWIAAPAPLFRKTLYGWDGLFHGTRTVLTIHNLGYQGEFPAHAIHDLDLGAHAEALHQDDLRSGVFGFLKTGILYADLLTTVSETYAREIRTPEYGFGLDPLLRQRSDRLLGIVNGVDYDAWNPETDELIPTIYGVDSLDEKADNKTALLRRVGLPDDPETPLLGVVSRLVYQKGFHLAYEPLGEVLGAGRARLVALGTGEDRFERLFRELEHRFPEQARYVSAYSEELAHWIEAGADLFLMPSLYEPCGLNQMYSMKYGTLPVVHKTGGLADTVRPFDPETGEGTGFVFEHADVQGFRWALNVGLDLYHGDRDAWRRAQENAMQEDFSWERQGNVYRNAYRRLLGG